MTAVTWRDFAERLTPAQVAEMEHCEREQIPPGIYSPHRAINVAQSFIRSNEAQVRFADVPVPADALDVPSPWVDYDETRWWRSYTAHRTVLDFGLPNYPGHDGTVVIEVVGNQYSDGTVEHTIRVEGGDALDELDTPQAREVAAALIAVAERLDAVEVRR